MSKNKKRMSSKPGGQSQTRPAVSPVPRPVHVLAEEIEPVAERRPVPVLLIAFLILLVYLGDMYVMEHGADVMGKAGPFPREVSDPFRTYDEIVAKNPESPEDKLLKMGRSGFELYCAACHASSGQGNPSTGIPPLAGSEWVKTPGPGRAIRIVLHAVRGPIAVAGKTWDNPGMLAWGEQLKNDEEIAAIVSYIRANKDWGNNASFVKADAVKKVRDTYGSREPWVEPELLKIPETD